MSEYENKITLTPEETVLAYYQETWFRLEKSGFSFNEVIELMGTMVYSDEGPKEKQWIM